MKTTLLIMAAGIGSRFGTGIKQLEPVDDAGHIIMDYSIHDAIEAGFNHVVFIIRKDIEKEFKEVIGDRIAAICSAHNVTVDYAFQDIKDIPGILPDGRTKPWGTGQAVLAAKKVIKTPFIVINADDYYGKEGFKAVHEYLVNGGKSCMAGFVLKNGWVFCQITFLIYMIILAVMDIKRRQVHLGFLLSGIIWVILSVICERTVSTGEIIAGILAGAFFLLLSKLTKESFGYGDSILIVIMGAFLGFWSLMSVLFMAFFMAGLFSVIMLLKTKFHKKSKFPFIPFLMAAYAGGIILNGY